MKVTRFIDRKLLLVVTGPIVRHLANALSVYMAGQGVSSGLLNQLEAGVIAAATLAINVLFELRDQGNVAERAAVKSARFALDHAYSVTDVSVVPDPWRNVSVDYDATRDRFDRESA